MTKTKGRMSVEEIKNMEERFLAKESIEAIAEKSGRSVKSVARALGQEVPRCIRSVDEVQLSIEKTITFAVQRRNRKNPVLKVSFSIGLDTLKKLMER